jgi:two-component system, chemotaxis family, protein-glutamate methylesterase/glutaminase
MAKTHVNNLTGLIVIGGSSGSLKALMLLLPQLKSCRVPVIIVMHRNSEDNETLRDLLAAKTLMQVKEADEKEQMLPGMIYLAPPGFHLLTETDGSLSLDASEKVLYCRPSIDVTFSCAAQVFTSTLIAVLLSGSNADGAAGMISVKQFGGKNIAQDPGECVMGYMPQQAIKTGVVDDILSAIDIGKLLHKLQATL